MNTKIALFAGLSVFAAGLVSGMFTQRMLAPEPEAVALAPEPAAADRGETLAQMEQRRPRTENRVRDDAFDWMDAEPEPMAREAVLPGEPGEAIRPPPRDRENGDGPAWGRVAWTNREAWMEQRRIEQLARMQNIRSNLVEKAELNEQQEVRFDVLVAAMNMRLLEQSRTWQEAIENGTMGRHEVRARAMKEIGSALSVTYDELDRNMPPEWRTATTNESVNLWTFIEPEVWGAMRPLMGRGRPPRPNPPAQ
ncbi:MAG TPA: hypothetical protein PKE12_07865 [Kiritimatiellia bacterium]|nr:hypothetical protein [Kiritimatiellia bacterium]